ncbi:hypothetical protein ES703_124077 [subsurface metagenome]
MITIGIRELKIHLSRYIGKVESGEEIIITNRNEPVARIIREPSSNKKLRDILTRMAGQGLIILPKQSLKKRNTLPIAIKGKKMSEIIIGERR